jgi:hypothetical protein
MNDLDTDLLAVVDPGLIDGQAPPDRNSAGAAVNPVEAMLDSLERVGGGPKQSGVASLPEACR